MLLVNSNTESFHEHYMDSTTLQGVFTRYHLRYIERNAFQSSILARLMHPNRTPA